jgi:hypothetical protein
VYLLKQFGFQVTNKCSLADGGVKNAPLAQATTIRFRPLLKTQSKYFIENQQI